MSNNYQSGLGDDALKTNAVIKVIGIGGGGSNAVNRMVGDNDEVEYWVFNTDVQALSHSDCENRLILGEHVTRGLGSGGIPETGRAAAEDSIDNIRVIVENADMVFIACGEGGGTGTGAAPVVARCAKEAGCLVLAIVTRPFTFEGKQRLDNSIAGIEALKAEVDSIIVVSNDKLTFNGGDLSFDNAFTLSDTVLARSVKTITDLILKHGKINLDFADVKQTLQHKELALIGIGEGEGDNKAIDASKAALDSPLLESSIVGARSMIINFTVGPDTKLSEVDYAVRYIKEQALGHVEDEDDGSVSVIFGARVDPDLCGKMQVALIATDFDKDTLNTDTRVFNRPRTYPRTTTLFKNKTKNAEPEPAYEEENHVESDVVRQIEEEKSESILPDYFRNRFDDDDDN